MKFELTDTQKSIQKLARDAAAKEVAPGAAHRDETSTFDRGVLNKLAALGLNGIPFPEAYGGVDADYLSFILAVEELCKVDAGVGTAIAVNVGLYGWPIFNFGSEDQKKKWIVPVTSQQKMGAFALTEPSAGTDAAMQLSTATADDKGYVINGSKIFITNGGEAEYYLFFAMTDKSKGLKGISAFLAEKGTPGLSFGKVEHKLGIHSSVTREIIFQDMRIPRENLLGKEGEGFKIAMATLDGGRISIGAQAVGTASAALEHAIKYTKERVQFGKPIASNQALQFMMADMATKIDAARLLVYRAAWLKDNKLPFSKEAAMAKMYASDIAMEVTTDAVQLFGGYGYTREYPVEQLMRDAKITQIYEGTNQVQRMVISGAILR
jgi:alkylation response protein AidB-like acyl-CoA dehydrogenase